MTVGAMSFVRAEPNPVPTEAIDLMRQLEASRESRLFLFVTPRTVDRQLVDAICAQQADLANIDTLDVLLDSIGGDIDAMYRLVNVLRRRVRRLRVIVSDYAKSAATFFCLGADEICMAAAAELGPLDAQVPAPGEPGEWISALDGFKALEFLRQYAFETLDLTVKMILRRTPNISVKEAVKQAVGFVSVVVTPLYQQVKPRELGEWSRRLEVGEAYARRVMARHSYRAKTAEEIDDLLEKIVRGYPAHTFVIDLDEAQALGLNAHPLTDDEQFLAQCVLQLLDECVGLLPAEAQPPEEAAEETVAASLAERVGNDES
jgi:hypothetical protein